MKYIKYQKKNSPWNINFNFEKVQITLRFKNNREHREAGFELMGKFLSNIGEEFYTIEKNSFLAGNQIICKLNPKIQN